MLKVLQINAMNNGNTRFIAENIKTKCIDAGIECRNAYGYTKNKEDISNLDNVVIGAFSGSVKVAIYSYALLFFSMFRELSTAISGVMLPTVINVLANDDDKYTKLKT